MLRVTVVFEGPSMRAAIYARVSTDKQSADSPADQTAHCRRYAEAREWDIVDHLVVGESGISGASRHNRPGILKLVGLIDEWDVLLCYEFSRITRDMEDLGWLRNRLRTERKTAIEAATGRDIHDIGARVIGVLNEEYLSKLMDDISRGLRGRVERGLSVGGLPYGYRSVAILSGQVNSHGNSMTAGYRWEPDPDGAPVVLRIFELYAAGEGAKAIARRLNQDHVKPPRPRSGKRRAGWTFTALHPLLQNPIYRGEYIWNKSEWIKDHETGKRRRHERPEREWVRQSDEQWRIVSDELWEAAQWVRSQRRHESHAPGSNRFGSGGSRRGSPRTLLGGFLACGVCDGSIYQLYSNRLGCGRGANGPEACDSDLRIAREELENRVLGAVQDQILVPENLAYLVESALKAAERPGERERLQAELGAVEGKIARLVRLAEETDEHGEIRDRLAEVKAEQRRLESALEAAHGESPDMATLQDRIETEARNVRDLLLSDPDKGREALRLLFGEERLRLVPDAKRGYAILGNARLDWLVAGGRFNRYESRSSTTRLVVRFALAA